MEDWFEDRFGFASQAIPESCYVLFCIFVLKCLDKVALLRIGRCTLAYLSSRIGLRVHQRSGIALSLFSALNKTMPSKDETGDVSKASRNLGIQMFLNSQTAHCQFCFKYSSVRALSYRR